MKDTKDTYYFNRAYFTARTDCAFSLKMFSSTGIFEKKKVHLPVPLVLLPCLEHGVGGPPSLEGTRLLQVLALEVKLKAWNKQLFCCDFLGNVS